MGWKDFLGFFVGRRDAILAVACARHTLLLGGLLVLGAALAREYDRRWLGAEWWHLLLPFAASLALAGVQFWLFWSRREPYSGPTVAAAFRGFLACFWMTAPLALLYAIPYEHFLSSRDAVRANLVTLALVAVVRGLLICRVLQVLANVRWWQALLVSLGVAQVAVVVAVLSVPMPIIDLMAGIAFTPEERLLADLRLMVLAETVYVGWLVGGVALMVLLKVRSRWTPELMVPSAKRITPALWAIAIAPILMFLCLLPITQPPHRLAHHADAVLRKDIDKGLEFMNGHPRSAFPPGWRPLPHVAYDQPQPEMIDVLEHVPKLPQASWVRAYYLAELERVYFRHVYITTEEWERVMAVVDGLPNRDQLLTKYADEVRMNDIDVGTTRHGRGPTTSPSTTQASP